MFNLTFLTTIIISSFVICLIYLIYGMVKAFTVYSKDENKSFIVSLIALIVFIISLMIYSTITDDGEYYLGAEKYAQKDNEIIFTTDQGFYKWESFYFSEDKYPDTTYLLTMYDNGTKDTKDDIISVVWESKN